MIISPDEINKLRRYTPERVECWRTQDGKLFQNRSSANHHQEEIDDVKVANAVLTRGGSVADALRAADYLGTIFPVFERITKDTQLVISHWQCRDTPGYKQVRFELGLYMFVFGDAGSWSGPYGNQISLTELSQFAHHKDTIFSEANDGSNNSCGID